jgi:hypothetical protein
MKVLVIGRDLGGDGYRWVDAPKPWFKVARPLEWLPVRGSENPPDAKPAGTFDTYVRTDLVTVDFVPVLTLEGKEEDLGLSPVHLYREQAPEKLRVVISNVERQAFAASDSFLPNRLWTMARALFEQTLEMPEMVSYEQREATTAMTAFEVVARGRVAVNNAINPAVMRQEARDWREALRTSATRKDAGVAATLFATPTAAAPVSIMRCEGV